MLDISAPYKSRASRANYLQSQKADAKEHRDEEVLYIEICTLVQETAQIVNSSPLAGVASSDLHPPSPTELVMGRATEGVPFSPI